MVLTAIQHNESNCVKFTNYQWSGDFKHKHAQYIQLISNIPTFQTIKWVVIYENLALTIKQLGALSGIF